LDIANGEGVFIKNGDYNLNTYGIILPQNVTMIGEFASAYQGTRRGVVFYYSGNDWALKTNNRVGGTYNKGILTLKNLVIRSTTTSLNGGLLVDYLENGVLERIWSSSPGSPVGNSTGIMIHEHSGNQVLVNQCYTSGWSIGFWVTSDWTKLEKCMSSEANTAFLVNNSNGEYVSAKRPIQTIMEGCLAFHPENYGYRIDYAHGFNLDNCAFEGDPGNSATAFRIDNGPFDQTARGTLSHPTFHGTAPSVYYDFEMPVRNDRLVLVPESLEHYVTENRDTTTLLNTTTSIAVTHGCNYTPNAGDISVHPIESLGSASYWYVDTITSTQFTIHVDADPGQDIDFAWNVDKHN